MAQLALSHHVTDRCGVSIIWLYQPVLHIIESLIVRFKALLHPAQQAHKTRVHHQVIACLSPPSILSMYHLKNWIVAVVPRICSKVDLKVVGSSMTSNSDCWLKAAAMNVNEFSSPSRAKSLVSGVISGAISFEEADAILVLGGGSGMICLEQRSRS